VAHGFTLGRQQHSHMLDHSWENCPSSSPVWPLPSSHWSIIPGDLCSYERLRLCHTTTIEKRETNFHPSVFDLLFLYKIASKTSPNSKVAPNLSHWLIDAGIKHLPVFDSRTKAENTQTYNSQLKQHRFLELPHSLRLPPPTSTTQPDCPCSTTTLSCTPIAIVVSRTSYIVLLFPTGHIPLAVYG